MKRRWPWLLAAFDDGLRPYVDGRFNRARRHVQSIVDRRFDRSRYDAQRTVEGFAAGLRNEFDFDRVGSGLGAVVGLALAPTAIGVRLRPSLRARGL